MHQFRVTCIQISNYAVHVYILCPLLTRHYEGSDFLSPVCHESPANLRREGIIFEKVQESHGRSDRLFSDLYRMIGCNRRTCGDSAWIKFSFRVRNIWNLKTAGVKSFSYKTMHLFYQRTNEIEKKTKRLLSWCNQRFYCLRWRELSRGNVHIPRRIRTIRWPNKRNVGNVDNKTTNPLYDISDEQSSARRLVKR